MRIFGSIHSPPIARILLMLAILVVVQATALGDALTVAGYTQGAFGGGTAEFEGLWYTSGSFQTTTNTEGVGLVDNLGTFSLNTDRSPFAFTYFTLQVTITAPPAGTGITQLPVLLSVVPLVGGGAFIGGGKPIEFDSAESGRFQLYVSGLTLAPGAHGTLTGAVVQSVPEPLDLALPGVAALAIGLSRLRRRTS